MICSVVCGTASGGVAAGGSSGLGPVGKASISRMSETPWKYMFSWYPILFGLTFCPSSVVLDSPKAGST